MIKWRSEADGGNQRQYLLCTQYNTVSIPGRQAYDGPSRKIRVVEGDIFLTDSPPLESTGAVSRLSVFKIMFAQSPRPVFYAIESANADYLHIALVAKGNNVTRSSVKTTPRTGKR